MRSPLSPAGNVEADIDTLVALAQRGYAPVAQALDGLGVAFCLFDGRDRTLCWNETFLRFFPDHRNAIHVGEHYRTNLRRFYLNRLKADELPFIDEYIERGLARHRAQQRPFTFEHRGRWVKVAVSTIPGIGRMRVWTEVARPASPGPSSREIGGHDSGVTPGSFNSLPDALVVLDGDGKIVTVNDQFRSLYGLSPTDIVASRTLAEVLEDLWSREPDGRAAFQSRVLPMLRDEQRFAGVAFEVALPGDRWVRIIEQRATDGLKTCIHFDVSAYRREQRELQEAEAVARAHEQRFRAVIERSPVGMCLTTEDGIFTEVNAAFCRVLGYTATELVGKSVASLVEGADLEKAEEIFHKLVNDEIAAAEAELRLRHRNGSSRWINYSAVHIREEPAQGLIIAQIQDVTARLEAETERDRLLKELAHLALHDPLTGLPNRRAFEEALERALDDAAGYSGTHAFCFIDLDGFKAINDGAGHGAGDAVLREVSRVIAGNATVRDTASRLGGDEFGLLLVDCEARMAEMIGQRILRQLSDLRVAFEGKVHRIGASIGITLLRAGDRMDEVMRRADTACYEAKYTGRSRLVMAPETPPPA